MPENDIEYVVFFEVEDTEDGAIIVTGLESLANEIFDGEIFVWDDGTDRNWGFNYLRSFDIVEGNMTINFQSIGAGEALMEGTFTTTSDTTGTFSMRRVASRTELQDGEHRIAFVDLNDETRSAALSGSRETAVFLREALPERRSSRSRARSSPHLTRKTRGWGSITDDWSEKTVTRSRCSDCSARIS